MITKDSQSRKKLWEFFLYISKILLSLRAKQNELYMKFLGIIPARYASTRFPGKPLADLCGKPMIQRVYERVIGTVDELYVATDDTRIYDVVKDFGGKAVMTSKEHTSGTGRCRQALEIITRLKEGGHDDHFNVIINIQGDEPFVCPSQITLLKDCFNDPATKIATLAKLIDKEEDMFNPNIPKVVITTCGRAMYFSRKAIPYYRGKEKTEWLQLHPYYKHIGLYAYRNDVLKEISALSQSSAEIAEKLEQLRWLENGYEIKVAITTRETIGVDTPEDLVRAEDFLKRGGDYCI